MVLELRMISVLIVQHVGVCTWICVTSSHVIIIIVVAIIIIVAGGCSCLGLLVGQGCPAVGLLQLEQHTATCHVNSHKSLMGCHCCSANFEVPHHWCGQ